MNLLVVKVLDKPTRYYIDSIRVGADAYRLRTDAARVKGARLNSAVTRCGKNRKGVYTVRHIASLN